MALTKVGVVYDKNTLVRIRVIVSDVDDSHVDLHKQTMTDNEQWADMPIDDFYSCSYNQNHLSAGNHSIDSYLAFHLGLRDVNEVKK